MNCSMCDNEKQLKAETIRSFKYKDCGLDNIILHGVKSFVCQKCGEVYYSFGDIELLHRLISKQLILKKDTLTGKEIRFLRKQLGFSGSVFAKLVGYESEHLSRIENGKAVVQDIFDRLVRMLIIEKMENHEYTLQDMFLEGKLMKLEWIEFSLSGRTWKLKKQVA